MATDILGLDHSSSSRTAARSHEPVSRNTESMTTAAPSTPAAEDLDENIQNFEFTSSSPYAQRRAKPMTSQLQLDSPEGSGEIRMYEDHYSRNISGSSSTGSSEEFTSFSNEEIKNL